MKKLCIFLIVVEVAACFSIYSYAASGIRDSYFVALAISKMVAFGLLFLTGLAVAFKPVRAFLGVPETRQNKTDIISLAILAPLLAMTFGNILAASFGGLGGDF